METAPAVLIMLAVSAQFALQAPVNAQLARATGRVPAALISFLVGMLFLTVAVLVSGGFAGLAGIGEASPIEFAGGVIGAAFVLTTLAAVPIIGAGGVAAAAITGQMIGSILLDAVGGFDLDVEPITIARGLGALLLLTGTILIVGGVGTGEASDAERQRSRFGPRATTAAILAGGLLLAAHAPINAGLGDAIGGLEASWVNFVVGSACLALAVSAGRSWGRVPRLAGVPRRYLTGGLVGAVYVTAAVLLVRTIGAGGIAAATITGQLAASVALDRAGALGLSRRPLTSRRLAALGLLGTGTYLVVG